MSAREVLFAQQQRRIISMLMSRSKFILTGELGKGNPITLGKKLPRLDFYDWGTFTKCNFLWNFAILNALSSCAIKSTHKHFLLLIELSQKPIQFRKISLVHRRDNVEFSTKNTSKI